jgi:hypothetical protein
MYEKKVGCTIVQITSLVPDNVDFIIFQKAFIVQQHKLITRKNSTIIITSR